MYNNCLHFAFIMKYELKTAEALKSLDTDVTSKTVVHSVVFVYSTATMLF